MRFREGDLCTHNKYECKVLAVNEQDKKVCIAYAVFVGDERVFDEEDIKWVPESRVTLVRREWAGVPRQQLEDSAPVTACTPRPSRGEKKYAFSPTFSQLQERWQAKQDNHQRGAKSVRNSVISLKSVSSSSDSSVASSPVRRKKNVRKRRAAIDDTPIPIVPDSYVDEEDSDVRSLSSEDSEGSGDSFSQERTTMIEIASMFENRAERDKSLRPDEVEFGWDAKRKRLKPLSLGSVSSFLIEDTPPVAVSPPVAKKRIEDLKIEFDEESVSKCDNHSNLVKRLWTMVDEMFIPPKQLDRLILLVVEITSRIPINISSEVRMEFTDVNTGFKSLGGWCAGIAAVMLLGRKFKPNLMTDFLEKIRKKISAKFELTLCHFLSLLHIFPLSGDAVFSPSTVKEMCAKYSSKNAESQALIEACVAALLGHPDLTPFMNITETLPSLSLLLSLQAPLPADTLASNCEKLTSEFSKNLSKFISEKLPSLSYHPLIVKTGAFLTDQADKKIEFGKYRGSEYRAVVRDRGFCDWTEGVVEPSSTAFVDWLDFVLQERQMAVLGPRTVRADVELIRLTICHDKENEILEKIKTWFLSRACVLQLCLEFFTILSKRFPESHHVASLLSYSTCAFGIFARLAAISVDPWESQSLNRPRAEIVKEVFRPLVDLSKYVPSLRLEIGSAILAARAHSHGISVSDARDELKSFHAILL